MSNTPRSLTAVLISPDRALREELRQAFLASARGISVALEIEAPFQEISAEHLKALRQADPDIVLLDLEHDPGLGIRLAQFLGESHPAWRFVAVGPALSPELLIAAMQAGITEYVPKPVTRDALNASLERIEKKLGRQEGAAREPGRLLAVFSPKGGSGSTTVATNLAIQLHQLTGKKTLLLDLDLELGEIALFLGMQPRFNFVDMVRNFHRMDADLLASYIECHDTGVHLLSAPYQPEKAESVNGDQIRTILQFLKRHYDYVVVDTSKSFHAPTLATFEQADQIYLVANVDLPSLRNIKRCVPLIDRVAGSVKDRVRLVINRYHPENVISVEEAEQSLNMPVYWKLANDYEHVIGAINAGKPVILTPGSAFTRDLKGLVAEITGLQPATNGRQGPLKMFSRFFRGSQPAEGATHG
jgi:pilus assembly protein CpaE